MSSKENQALERLTPKLTALRKTLRGEERKQLDRLVLAAQAEVTAHSLDASKTPSKTPTKVSEVSMHSASPQQKILGTKTPQAQSRQSAGRIELDAKLGVYRVTIL